VNPKRFFAELKRRNVYKVAIAYGVVGWLVTEIATQVFPFFEIPNWIVRLVVLLIVIGFPIALVIAWAFELTPEGLKRTEVADAAPAPHSPHRAWIYVVIIAGAMSVGVFLVGRYTSSKQGGSAASPVKSIAVLPFENLSRDPDNAYFADGIHDEILSTLGKINDLRVISRTSTAKYKSRPDNLRQVAAELGAATILEGSVQRAAERIRIIVQLIDATSDAHLWSETYDRDLKDVFSVQSEVAQKIATSLKAKLSPGDTESLAQTPTRNPEAYQLYLKAGYYVRQADLGNSDPAVAMPQAIALYQEAIAKDPNFALAYAQMSYVHSWMHWFSVDDSPERLQLAEEAARRAVELNPQLPEVHLAVGYVAYWGRRDYATALGEFERARMLLPNDVDVATAIASIHRRRGEWEAAIEEFSRAAALDPRSPARLDDVAYGLAAFRRYREALESVDRALTVQPDYWGALCTTAMLDILSKGDVNQATAVLARLPANVDPQGRVRFARFKVAMWSRNFAEALRVLEGAPDWIRTEPGHRPVATATLRGQAFEAAGKQEAARASFEAAIPLLKNRIESGAGEPSVYASLGRAYAGLARKDEAIRNGLRAVELLPVSKDAFDGPFYLEQLAEIQARVGNKGEAITLLRQLLEMPAGFVSSPALLRLNPAWDSLRNDPRFQKLCEEKKS
jgi:TolB-like protein